MGNNLNKEIKNIDDKNIIQSMQNQFNKPPSNIMPPQQLDINKQIKKIDDKNIIQSMQNQFNQPPSNIIPPPKIMLPSNIMPPQQPDINKQIKGIEDTQIKIIQNMQTQFNKPPTNIMPPQQQNNFNKINNDLFNKEQENVKTELDKIIKEQDKNTKNQIEKNVNQLNDIFKKPENKIKEDIEKANKIIQFSKEKENELIMARKNEERSIEYANKIKKDAEEASMAAINIINKQNASQEIKNNLINNANILNEEVKLAEYEVQKAIEEKTKAEKKAEIARQQAKLADELLILNNKIDISGMKTPIKISNKIAKSKFKLFDGFDLKCPDGFIQNNTRCDRLIEISNSSFGEDNIEEFSNSKNTNYILILIILGLTTIFICRNPNLFKKK